MLKSIVTTAIRNILRNRTFSLINLIGLSVSMSLGLLIILIVRDQYTFDNFHRDPERIYRVNTMAIRTNGGQEPYATVPYPVGSTLMENYAFTDNVVRISRQLNGDLTFHQVIVPIRGLIVDPSFLSVFNFPLDRGNPSTALNDPKSLVLTREAAEKIFGKEEPLGQTVSVRGYGEFTVTGVLKKFMGKTHFEFEALASTAALPAFEKDGVVESILDDWNNYYYSYVYLKIKEGRTQAEVVNALKEVTKKNYAGLKLETRDKGYEFYLQPLSEITPGPLLSNQMGRGLPSLLIVFLGTLAGIVMIMACVNYTNLMIARSLNRAREVGLRKVVGAMRWQVFAQFVGETIVFAMVALATSYLFLQLLLPAFMQLHITQEFAINPEEDFYLYVYFILFAFVTGLLAGLLPAGYLSAFKPAKVLKNAGNLTVYARFTLRKMLMVTQFTFSIVFVIVALVIYRQLDFMISADYGINDKNIINVQLQGLPFEKLSNELQAVKGVENIAGVSHALGTWEDWSDDYKRKKGDEPFVMRDFRVNENYLPNLEVKFVAGKNFELSEEGKTESHIIINEKALEMFGFSDALSAIGQPVYAGDSIMLKVIGVVKDFHFRPLNSEIGPLAFRFIPSNLYILSMKIQPGSQEEVVTALTAIWKKLDPIHPINWSTMEAQIDQAYVDSGFTDVLTIVGYITFLTISLACLGMLGMAMYATQTRIKEVGIRKTLGASEYQITLLLSRSFLFMILLAILVGAPVSYFLSNSFLELYAYRIEISVGILVSGIAVIALLGVLTIGSQTWRAAMTNPVNSLKYE